MIYYKLGWNVFLVHCKTRHPLQNRCSIPLVGKISTHGLLSDMD